MPKTVFILSHTNGQPGGLDKLEEFINTNGYRKIKLLHPLDDYAEVDTTFMKAGGTVETIARKPQGILNLIQDFWISTKYIRRVHFDIFIGASNFDTIPAIFCRKFLHSKIERIIYYPRDFSEDRYNNRLLNKIYTRIESIACKNSDLIVNNTKRAELKRLKLGLNKDKSVIIPNPVNLSNPKFNKKKIDKTHFIYIGDVNKEHGLYEVIKAISPIIKKLVIIGSGNDWERVTDFAKSQGFETEFYYSKPQSFVIDFLQSYDGFGLAPYNQQSKWTYYCSPLKVGEYITCGLPVLMSSVPEIANSVKRNAYGIVFNDLNIKSITRDLKQFRTADYYLKASRFYQLQNTQVQLKKLAI